MIRVHAFGRYSHRQPLAYPTLAGLCADAITPVPDIAGADLVVVAHTRDITENAGHLRAALRPGQPLVLLSEEPLWDTVWGLDPLARHQSLETPDGPLPFVTLNHVTSTIFEFARLPYFLLTDLAFTTRYARWFHRNAALAPADWQDIFAAARHRVGFVAEYRDGAQFDARFDAAPDLFGMGALRTRIALACPADRTLRTGAGWNDLPRRQDLPDWHLEKFLDLDRQVRVLSAIENTHQNAYVSEKLFDAFAVGAVPACIAGPRHRLHDLGLTGAWINLYGLPEASAAQALCEAPLDGDFPGRYAAAQRALAALFGNPAVLVAERRRLRAALVAELTACL